VIHALTSLPPDRAETSRIRESIESWRKAGLDVVAFNHPSEIADLHEDHDVTFVPVTDTAPHVFGRHCIPLSAMLRWAAEHGAQVLLINADITLGLTAAELDRIRRISAGGLCSFVRYNHTGDLGSALREPFGFDAFLLDGRDVPALPPSFLGLGQPFWDYVLPHAFAAHGLPVYGVGFPAAFHLGHETRWSWDGWHRCALEFARITGEATGESLQSCQEMSWRVRRNIEAATTPIASEPVPIRDWVRQRFSAPGSKLFLELGAHRGTDTAWLATLPGVTIHAFEPDPRNSQPPRDNLTLHRAAVAAHDGRGPLLMSAEGWGHEWTLSSSIKRPKNHLQRFPVTFGETVEVELVALDTFHRERGLDIIDFIWADVQGAEREMVRGAHETLRRTRYLYTEYSDDELYEDQATLDELLELLPDFRVLELWPDDVLLENRRLAA
jgi:2-O-methyltransferase